MATARPQKEAAVLDGSFLRPLLLNTSVWVQDYFTTFPPKGVTLLCHLWFMGTRGLHTPDLTTLTANPRAANPVTIPRPSHQSKRGFSGGGGLGAKPVGCEGSLFSGSRVSGPVLGCRQCAGASRLPPEPGASP